MTSTIERQPGNVTSPTDPLEDTAAVVPAADANSDAGIPAMDSPSGFAERAASDDQTDLAEDITTEHAVFEETVSEDDASEDDASAVADRTGSGTGSEDGTEGEVWTEEARIRELHTIVMVSPDEIHMGPNVRTDTKPSKSLVRDVKRRGVRYAVHCFRNAAGTLELRSGQKRCLAAAEAGTKVKVEIIEPPSENERTATVDRVVDQLNENDLREPHSHDDAYQAHLLLEGLGLSVTQISRQRSVPKKIVEQSLVVGKSKVATNAVETYSLDLEQAAALAEFENSGDEHQVRQLLFCLQTNPRNYDVKVSQFRQARKAKEAIEKQEQQLRRQLAEANVRVLENHTSDNPLEGAVNLDMLRPSPDAELGTVLTADDHASCAGHCAWVDERWDPNKRAMVVEATYGCMDPFDHGHARHDAAPGQAHDSESADVSDDDQRLAAQQRERARSTFEYRWVRENNKQWDAAVPVRRKWLSEFADRRTMPPGAREWLLQQKLRAHHQLWDGINAHGHRLARSLLKVDAYTRSSVLDDAGVSDPLETRIGDAAGPRAVVWDVFLTLCAYEDQLQRDAWRRPRAADKDYINAITRWGYKTSTVEEKVTNPDDVRALFTAQYDGEDANPADPVPTVDLDAHHNGFSTSVSGLDESSVSATLGEANVDTDSGAGGSADTDDDGGGESDSETNSEPDTETPDSEAESHGVAVVEGAQAPATRPRGSAKSRRSSATPRTGSAKARRRANKAA